jgi:hypothetical protein
MQVRLTMGGMVLMVVMGGMATREAMSVAVSSAPQGAATQGAAQVPKVEMVDNLEYASWAKHAVGTQVTLTTKAFARGALVSQSDVTYRLVKLTDKTATVELVLIDEQGVIRAPRPAEIPAKVPKAQVQGPGPVLGEGLGGSELGANRMGKEEVEVLGKKVQARLEESTEKVGGEEMRFKVWKSDEVPGGTVRMEGSLGDGTARTTMTVKGIIEGVGAAATTEKARE